MKNTTATTEVDTSGPITKLVRKLMAPYLARIEMLEAEVASLKGRKR